MLSRERYVARRTHIVAACRLVSSLLPRLGPPPVVAAAAWGGWRQFMLLSGALGVSTLPWLARLPFRVRWAGARAAPGYLAGERRQAWHRADAALLLPTPPVVSAALPTLTFAPCPPLHTGSGLRLCTWWAC